ncbi:hypothetical protein N0V88_004217 [Collariella sp. IMI 366227]|nr:hypothetical protein N0V88_004217 [Collariella sp. IMI 366227]
MPPRPSICGLQAALSSCRISTSTTAPTWRAAFTTTASTSQAFPPESPKFITIPEPPQSSEPRLPPIKGHLPVPRDIFPKREGNRKVTMSYIEAATPMSKAELAGEAPKSEEEARRRRMAAARRKAFESGIQGLYVRKNKRVQRIIDRSEMRRKANLAAATAPERPDDVFTRPTVRAATAEVTGVVPHAHRFEDAEKARVRHQEMQGFKAEVRRDALAQLYVAAKDFIVDEEELAARVEELFKPDTHKFGGMQGGESIWDQHEAPIALKDLRAEMTGTSKTLTNHMKSLATKAAQRQKTVSEELTGGKLE